MTQPSWHQRLYWRGALTFLAILGAFEFGALVVFRRSELSAEQAMGLAAAAAVAAVVVHTIIARAYIRRRIDLSRRSLMGSVAKAKANPPPDEFTILTEEVGDVVQDMRKRLVRLQNERRQLRTLLEGMGEGVLMLDDAEHVLVANSVAGRLLRLKKKHEGQLLIEVCDVPRLQAVVSEALWSGESATSNFEIDRRGHVRQVAATATPIVSADATTGVVVVLRDVTKLRQLEIVRSDFVSNVSHELRTPIATVSSAAETLLLADAGLEPPLKQFLETIHRNAQRMAAIVEDLLLLARLEAAGHQIELRDVSLTAVFDEVLNRCRPLAEAAGVGLVIDIDEELPPVFAEEVALQQILQNLIENAIKYTPADGTVTVMAHRKRSKRILLEVSDTGPGIAADHLERIFERFYRVDPGRSRDVGGTGLGLSIVKHHVRRLKGKIDVHSEPEHGTTFSLLLRVFRPEKAQ